MPMLRAVRMSSSVTAASSVDAASARSTKESKSAKVTIDEISPRSRLATNAPIPARTVVGRSIDCGAP